MIRVRRPAKAPLHLIQNGSVATSDLVRLFGAAPSAYNDGRSKFEFDNAVYGSSAVRTALQAAQFGKCCYCEGSFAANAAGDVDHFRPKAYAQQVSGLTRIYPGYFWLAYEWRNLLFCCQVCNRSHKRNLFPLSNVSERARKPTDRISRERPLLIDPGGSGSPRSHIRFRDEVPVHRSKKGETTIRVLKLDRPSLNDTRRTLLAELKRLLDVVRVFSKETDPEKVAVVHEARRVLNASRENNAPFSSMALDLIPKPV